eukprot:TRINITY_DN12466_c1_g1_i2.p1 TRINITY_DN12466_c1_g1~~TRINITY_DN12466_c1_g1_i2.p1  ORF type:complete len:218 (+),score=-23.23 TRINITY_DN12466_c1_g1_i2:346-999(+)
MSKPQKYDKYKHIVIQIYFLQCQYKAVLNLLISNIIKTKEILNVNYYQIIYIFCESESCINVTPISVFSSLKTISRVIQQVQKLVQITELQNLQTSQDLQTKNTVCEKYSRQRKKYHRQRKITLVYLFQTNKQLLVQSLLLQRAMLSAIFILANANMQKQFRKKIMDQQTKTILQKKENHKLKYIKIRKQSQINISYIILLHIINPTTQHKVNFWEC